MAGMLGRTGEAQDTQEAPSPGKIPPGKIQDILILQPLKKAMEPEVAKLFIAAAMKQAPEKAIAAQAISLVVGSAKAAIGQGVEITNEMVGNAVLVLIESLTGLLAEAKVIPKDQIQTVVQAASQLAASKGGPQDAPQPGPAASPPSGQGAPAPQGPQLTAGGA